MPTAKIDTLSEADKKAAESFSENYIGIAQKMINKGFNPTEMLLKMAEDFKKNGVDVIQAMLDKGFDFTELIKNFDIAIIDIFNVWDEKFRKKFQKTLDVESDEPSFFEWGHQIRERSGQKPETRI